jgi:tetratricopeptide (TPR) repeat protein
MTTKIAPGASMQWQTPAPPGSVPLPLWQVPTFFAGLIVFLAVAASIALRPAHAAREFERDLASVRAVLARPGESVQNSVTLAESLVVRVDAEPEKSGEAHFLLGSIYLRLAVQPAAGEAFRSKALKELEQAEALGVSAGDLPRLQYQIGTLLCQGGGDLRRAIEYLNRSIAQGADDPVAGYGLLATTLLRLQPPDYDAALRANQKQLEATVNDEATAAVRFRRAEILIDHGMRAEAIRVLERIGPTAPPAVRLAARSLQARCCMDEELWNMAVPLWKEVLTSRQETPARRARVLYWLGVCERKLDPPDDAGAAAAWEEAMQAGGEEGQAAALSLAELRLGGPDPGTAVACFARALEKTKSAADYHNAFIDLEHARQLSEQGCRGLCDSRDYEHALEIAACFQKLAQPGQSRLCCGEISEAWARDLDEQALAADAGKKVLQEQARVRFRQAGAWYEQAARERPAPEQPDLLWRSATCYTKAGAAEPAQAVLEAFLKLPVPAPRQAEGWFALAEARKALGKGQEARQAFYKSIEVPTSPVAARARLQLAAAEIEQNNFDQAEAILQQNLRSADTTPDREAHENSLYLLGNLLYRRSDYLKASVTLMEAVRQYPANPDGLMARARLADCYLKLAQETNQKLKGTESYADVHAHLVRARQDWLEKALEVYQKLADWIDRMVKTPGPAEAALRKEAAFAVAQCRYDLGEFVEAQHLYKQLFQRYARQVESLNACAKWYECYRGISAQEKAVALPDLRAAVQSALDALPAMPGHDFVGPHAISREDWGHWLGRLQAFLASGG